MVRPITRNADDEVPQLGNVGEGPAPATGFVGNGAEPGCPDHLLAKGPRINPSGPQIDLLHLKRGLSSVPRSYTNYCSTILAA